MSSSTMFQPPIRPFEPARTLPTGRSPWQTPDYPYRQVWAERPLSRPPVRQQPRTIWDADEDLID